MCNEARMLIKYSYAVLPKFDVKINSSAEVSIVQEEIKVEVCAT